MRKEQVLDFYHRLGLSQSAIGNRITQADMLIKCNPVNSLQKSGGGIALCGDSWSGEFAYPIIASDSSEASYFGKMLLKDADTYAFNIPSSGIPQPLTTIWTTSIIMQLFKVMTLSKLTNPRQQGGIGTTDVKLPTKAFAGFMNIYDDFTAGGGTSTNFAWISRQIAYFEQTLEYGEMQQAQFGLAKIDYVQSLREGMAITVSQFQNDIGFQGYTGIPQGDKPQLWGVINEVNLNPAITLPADGVEVDPLVPSIAFIDKNFNQQVRDIRLLVAEVTDQSQGNVSNDSRFILALPPVARSALSVPNAIAGVSVEEYLHKVYKNIQIEAVPNFDAGLVTTGEQTGQTIGMVLFQHPNGEMPYDELFVTKWQGHRPVVTHSAISEKVSCGLGGSILKYPFLVAYAYGV